MSGYENPGAAGSQRTARLLAKRQGSDCTEQSPSSSRRKLLLATRHRPQLHERERRRGCACLLGGGPAASSLRLGLPPRHARDHLQCLL